MYKVSGVIFKHLTNFELITVRGDKHRTWITEAYGTSIFPVSKRLFLMHVFYIFDENWVPAVIRVHFWVMLYSIGLHICFYASAALTLVLWVAGTFEIKD